MRCVPVSRGSLLWLGALTDKSHNWQAARKLEPDNCDALVGLAKATSDRGASRSVNVTSSDGELTWHLLHVPVFEADVYNDDKKAREIAEQAAAFGAQARGPRPLVSGC